jgi:hypothetical protein
MSRLRFLARDAGPEWNTLERPADLPGNRAFLVACDRPGRREHVVLDAEEAPALDLPDHRDWPALPWARSAALALPDGLAVLSPADCSDGMSDRSYGIAADLFLTGPDRLRLSGCCQLVRPECSIPCGRQNGRLTRQLPKIHATRRCQPLQARNRLPIYASHGRRAARPDVFSRWGCLLLKGPCRNIA